MTDDGWVKLYRKILDDPLWLDSTPPQKVVMITLLVMANHEPKQWVWQGKKFEVQAGQMITSTESIRRKSGKGISTKNIRSALDKFQKYDFLAIKPAKTGTLITIANWAKYQSCDAKVANQPAERWQRGGKEVATNKNVRTKDKDITTSKTLADDFEKLWNLYPRKEGKKPAFDSYKRVVTRKQNPATNKQIQNGIVAYCKELEAAGTDKQFVKQGSTFFSQEAWQDYTAIAEQQEAAKPKFDPDQWVLDTFSVYGSISQVLREIQDNNVPVDPERAKRLITEHLSSLGRDAASYS